MRDERQWKLGMSQFQGFRQNLPGYIGVELVNEYHSILSLLESASGEDLALFRIPDAELKPRIASFSMGTRRGPGRTNYSRENYCDSDFFQRKIDALSHYLHSVEPSGQAGASRSRSEKYRSMSDDELQTLAFRNHIRAHADGVNIFDRDMVINALLEIDRKSVSPVTHQVINYGTMTGSPIQQGTSHSNATIQFPFEAIQSILALTNELIYQASLSDEAKKQLTVDMQTIQPQLASSQPRLSIVKECLHSIRNILEGAAGSSSAVFIVHEITKTLALFH